MLFTVPQITVLQAFDHTFVCQQHTALGRTNARFQVQLLSIDASSPFLSASSQSSVTPCGISIIQEIDKDHPYQYHRACHTFHTVVEHKDHSVAGHMELQGEEVPLDGFTMDHQAQDALDDPQDVVQVSRLDDQRLVIVPERLQKAMQSVQTSLLQYNYYNLKYP